MATIGLKDIHIVKLTKDDETTLTYDTEIKKVPGAIDAKVSPKASTEKLFCDDKLSEIATSLGEIDVELGVNDLPLEIRAFMLGGTIVNGVLEERSSDIAPEIALGFKSQKSDGSYRYVWLTKGKAEPLDDEGKTKEDKVDFQTKSIKLTFMPRAHDDMYRLIADDGAVGFDGSKWFTIDTLTRKEATVPGV